MAAVVTRRLWVAGAAFTVLLGLTCAAADPAMAFVGPQPYITYGPGGAAVADTLPEWAAVGGATLGPLLLASAPFLVIPGDSGQPSYTETASAVVKYINGHGGFPTFDPVGGGLIGQVVRGTTIQPSTSFGQAAPEMLLDPSLSMYTASQILLEPWNRAFCRAVYFANGSPRTWALPFSPLLGVTQAVIDTACPPAWHTWYLVPTTLPPSQPTQTTLPGPVAPHPLPGPVVAPLVLLPGAADVGPGSVGNHAYCDVQVTYVATSANPATLYLQGLYDVGVAFSCNVAGGSVWASNSNTYGVDLLYVQQAGAHQGQLGQVSVPGPGSSCAGNASSVFPDQACYFYDSQTNRAYGAMHVGVEATNRVDVNQTFPFAATTATFPNVSIGNASCGGNTACNVDGYVSSVTSQVLPYGAVASMQLPGYPAKYFDGGQAGTATQPSTYTPTAPATAPSVTTKGNGSCSGVIDCTLDLGDRVVTQLATSATAIINGIVVGIDAGLGQMQTALVWVGNVANTWLQDIDGVLRSMSSQLTWLGGLVSGLDTDVVNAVNSVTSAVSDVVASVETASTAIVNAVAALPVTIATAVATQLQTLLVPTGTQVETTLQSVKTAGQNTFVGTAVTTVTSTVGSIVTAANGGINGSSCGPSLGFDAFSVAGQSMPGWRVYLPSAPGCPGNGPGGTRSSQDVQAYDLLGYRDLIRGLAAFLMIYGFVWSLIRTAPWNGKSDTIMPSLAERMSSADGS